MRAEWAVVPLGELCDILDSRRKPITKRDRKPGPYPYFGATGVLDYVSDHIFDEPLVLVGEDGAKWGAGDNSAFPISGKTWVNNHAHVLRPNRDKLTDDWLIYYLNFSDLSGFISGLTVPKLNQGRLREIPMPVPPLGQQKRIVAVLDEAFEGLNSARANAVSNLTDARDLFAAALKAEFSRSPGEWEGRALSEIGQIVTGSTPRTSDTGNTGSFIPFIKPGDFLPDGRLDYDNEGLSEKGATVSRVLPPGCAMMVCIGATIGKAGYSKRSVTTNQQINALIPKRGISSEFVYLQMIGPDFQRAVLNNSSQATLPIINKSKWSALKIKMPRDLALQGKIAEKMRDIRDHISELETCQNAAIFELNKLRQSLLQKAFSGELN